MGMLGKPGSKKSKSDEIHLRKKYSDPSATFLAWVNKLGLEKSFLGRWALHLDEQFGLRRLALLFLFALCLSFLVFWDFDYPARYDLGDAPSVDVKSPLSFQMVDEISTEMKRVEAEKNLPLIVDYERDIYEAIYARIYRSFRELRNLAKAGNWPKSAAARERAVQDFSKHKPLFVRELGVDIPDEQFSWLVRNRFSTRIENLLVNTISQWSTGKLIDLNENYAQDPNRQVVIREVTRREAESPGESYARLSEIRNIRNKADFSLEGVRGATRLSPSDQRQLENLAHSLLVPNVTLNKQEMAERQRKAREAVLPVQLSIRRNQTIVSANNPVKPAHLSVLNRIYEIKSSQRVEFQALLTAFLLVLITVVSFSFLRRFSRKNIRVTNNDLFAMGAIMIMTVLVAKGLLFLTETALVEKFGSMIPPLAYAFLSPTAMGAMILALLLFSSEIIWLFVFTMSVVFAAMMDNSLQVLVVTMVSGIAGARCIFGGTSRNQIYWAGLQTGMVSAIAIFLVVGLTQIEESGLLTQLLWCSGAGLISGVLSSFMALTFVPLVESAFNYTTDLKFLELGSLNHPLMKDLLLKAPGTYQHCMAVGTMCDAAAREIGANPLMAKVMAYYHDVGKMEHAQYFIENQRPGHNPHHHISPHMSKTILVAHVKDGAEMAIKHKLGKPIVDGILQHHGTTLISYFYNKALEEQDDDVTGHIEESDFRYPGPKPQFKEAALVMLADSIEATARSLDEPTTGRLNSIVENIIESKFMDGQLDECDLSIEDLATIKVTFKKILGAIYHQRMNYPHMRDGRLITVAKKQFKKF